jgi:hypothetical protein
MADRTLHIITPATDHDLLTLDEAKLMLGISLTDTSEDDQLALYITIASQTCARMCNRIFAKETLSESWRDIGDRRIFLSHWPVDAADVQSVESPSGTVLDPSAYELEELSGKVSKYDGWSQPIVVTYSGGYDLPAEAPMPLKRAAGLIVWQQKLQGTVATIGGIRQLSHKDSRVVFHDPLKILQAALGAAGTPMQSALMVLLSHYIRYEV